MNFDSRIAPVWQYLDELVELFEAPNLLTEVEMPDYITDDYEGVEW